MRQELLWFIHHVKISSGIHILQSVEWSPYDRMAPRSLATLMLGSGQAFGFWVNMPVSVSLPPDGPQDLIFFYEALAVCSAFYLGASTDAIVLPFTLTTRILLIYSPPSMLSLSTTPFWWLLLTCCRKNPSPPKFTTYLVNKTS